MIYSGVVLWGFTVVWNWFNIFRHPGTGLFFYKRHFRKIIPIIVLKRSFNVLIHHFPLLKISQDNNCLTPFGLHPSSLSILLPHYVPSPGDAVDGMEAIALFSPTGRVGFRHRLKLPLSVTRFLVAVDEAASEGSEASTSF